jgi:flagellar hook-associated protein 3 FlgL
MISNITPASQIFLAGVDQIQQRISLANQQVTSGLKISVASDAPDQIGDLLQLRANEAQNTQVQSNLSLELTNAQSADNALGSAIQMMDSVTQIAAEGASSTQTADTRTTLGNQVQSLLAQMVNISQTQVQGRFIFSGDDDQNPSYQLDLSAPNGVDQLSSAASTRQIQNPAGGTFQASLTAQQIFDDQNPDGSSAPDNVFAALNSLRTALLSNDTAGITAAQNMVKEASSHLNDSQSFYGNVESQIQNATTYATTYSTQLQAQIGGIEDADVASAATELTEANTQLQAAFEAQAKMPTTSLFSYLG